MHQENGIIAQVPYDTAQVYQTPSPVHRNKEKRRHANARRRTYPAG
jgi:hypothetical protein